MSKGLPEGVSLVPIVRFVDRILGRFLSEVNRSSRGLAVPSLASLGRQSEVVRRFVRVFEDGAIETRSRGRLLERAENYEYTLNRLQSALERGVKATVIAAATGDKFEEGFAKEQATSVGHRIREFATATDELRREAEANTNTDAGRALLDLLATHPRADIQGSGGEIWHAILSEIESDQGQATNREQLPQVQEESRPVVETDQPTVRPVGRLGDNADSDGQIFNPPVDNIDLSTRLEQGVRSIQERYGQLPQGVRDILEEQFRNLRDSVIAQISNTMSDNQGQANTSEAGNPPNQGDTVDASIPRNARPQPYSGGDVEPPAARRRLDEPDNAVAAGRSAGTGSTAELTVGRIPPNLTVAPGGSHLAKFDHLEAINQANEVIKFAAEESGSSVLLTLPQDHFTQRNSQKPTYRMSSAGFRGDVMADTRSKPWQLSSTTRIVDSVQQQGAAATTAAGFIGATFNVAVYQDPSVKSEQYEINPGFREALPQIGTAADKWYYILEQQTRVGGVFSEIVMARALEGQVSERRTGSLIPLLTRIVGELLWFRTGLSTDAAPEMGGGRVTMRRGDGGTDLWRTWPYQQTAVGGEFRNEPLTKLGYWDADDLERIAEIDIAATTVTRVIRSNLGDNSRNVVGQGPDGSDIPAMPEGWNLENTVIIPIRSTDTTQGAINWYWIKAHLGLTKNEDKEINAWWPNETADREDIRTFFTGVGTVSCAATTISWNSCKNIQHALLVFIDRGSLGNDVLVELNGQRRVIHATDDTERIQILPNFLNIVGFEPDVDVATVDHSSSLVATLERFDAIYKTTQYEIEATMAFLTRFGVWTNELPKAQGEQGVQTTDFGSNVMNIPLTESNVLYNSWANQNFRDTYVPRIAHPTSRAVTDVFGPWANAQRTVMRPSRVAMEINLHGMVLANSAGPNFIFGSTNGKTNSVGSVGVVEARGLVHVARGMDVIKPTGLTMRAASVDWVSAYMGPMMQAADILSYTLDDLLQMSSVSVREAGWYEGNNLQADGLYLLKGKIMPATMEKIKMIISPQDACWRTDIQAWGNKDNFADAFDFEFRDNFTGRDMIEGIRLNMDANRREGSFAPPSRVPMHVLALESSGNIHSFALDAVSRTAVDFSATGSVILSSQEPVNIVNPQRVGELLPQLMFTAATPYMMPSDLQNLSRVQNISARVRRTELFLMEETGASPTPFLPAEGITILPPAANPGNMFAGTLIDFAARIPCSAADATKDLRLPSRPRFQEAPWKWERLGVKTSSQLARTQGGVNPGLPYTVLQIGRFSSMPLFDQENAGLGDPRRQITENPDFLN